MELVSKGGVTVFFCLFVVQHLNVTDDERQKLQVGIIWNAMYSMC